MWDEALDTLGHRRGDARAGLRRSILTPAQGSLPFPSGLRLNINDRMVNLFLGAYQDQPRGQLVP